MHPLRWVPTRILLTSVLAASFVGAGPALGAGASVAITCTARITLTPNSGPPGSHVQMHVSGLCSLPTSVPIDFSDASGRSGTLQVAAVQNGSFTTTIKIPAQAAIGMGTVSIYATFYCPPILCHRPTFFVDTGSAPFDVT